MKQQNTEDKEKTLNRANKSNEAGSRLLVSKKGERQQSDISKAQKEVTGDQQLCARQQAPRNSGEMGSFQRNQSWESFQRSALHRGNFYIMPVVVLEGRSKTQEETGSKEIGKCGSKLSLN